MKGNYQLDILSSGGKGGRRTSSITETDWAFPACLSNTDNEAPPTITKEVPPVPTTASCNFERNQYRFIDMEQLSGNISTHLTCRKCADKHLDELPTVKLVLMGDYGAACKVGIHCPTCETVSTLHQPKTVSIECSPNLVSAKRKKKKSRCNDSSTYSINYQLVLLMQSLGLGCDGVMTLLTLLGIGGPIKTWKHHSLFQRIEEMLAMVDFVVAVRCVPNHLFDEHDDCGAWCKPKDDPDYDKGKYWDPVTYCKMKERVWKALNDDLSLTSLRRVHHKYNTQLCEALQNAVSYRAPKNKTYSRTISLYGRVCIVAGEHNTGKDTYVKELMKRMGIDLPGSSINILEYKTKRKKKQREYQNTPAQKYRRKKKEHDTMKEQRVKDEKSRATYGRRIKRELERKPRDRCGDCQMFDHRTKKTKTCFANPSHPLHETFNNDRPTAVVLAGEAYVTRMKAKKRGRNKKYQLPKAMWDQVMANKELNVRGALCCECDATEGVASLKA